MEFLSSWENCNVPFTSKDCNLIKFGPKIEILLKKLD